MARMLRSLTYAAVVMSACGGRRDEPVDHSSSAVVCVTDAAVFRGCDGVPHDYAIQYSSPDPADINARVCHAGETDAGPACQAGSDCEILYPGLDGMDNGVCR